MVDMGYLLFNAGTTDRSDRKQLPPRCIGYHKTRLGEDEQQIRVLDSQGSFTG